jgi:hypothetical protein
LNKGKARKGLAASILSVGVQVTEEPRKRRNYKAVLKYNRKDPRKIPRKAIGSIFSTVARTPLPATHGSSGDATTWSSKRDEHQQESFEGPPPWRLD